ncbi:flagellar hook-basal body complex protein FliE [Acidihalobacter ferrooxydans]|uniref:Flagellar hook-basal body complex protein FliE n=1 Tax=Acidihalobacter ferrooxydans TaxID=1765967 RepID=A0A1P8ULA3_9GAMM|nr:flagellar hook-basal body complex protein FliE [Acidihalobacter ferrooxydans]APZ44610.1 flagellar hook-basal body complex protein FliE [Acidihalobacter ferrooxydans]
MSGTDINQVLAQMRAMAAAAEGNKTSPAAASDAGKPDFGKLLEESINKVNEAQQHAGNLALSFEAGNPNVNLGEVMVALQKASLSFEAMTQVRNKLVSAYQEVMNMQV